MNNRFLKNCILIICILLNSLTSFSQKKIVKNGSFYASWGYNREWYTKSDLHVSQPGLNNNYTFVDIKAHDHPGWDNDLFHKALTIPQYNYRIGYFFNEKQTWGVEINFDHTKYVVTYGQDAHVKGTMNGQGVDSTAQTGEKVLLWQLNNGANFLEFNLVRKLSIINKKMFQFDCLLKAGVGPVIPHVENTIYGNKNNPHFQFGGWNIDTDVSFRATFFKHVFLEYANKVVYARYSQLKIYDGMARQAFGCYEMFLCIGGTLKL
jgi:hypothetical protein